ncbi:protein kinase domain containing protein [Stylonychia lemnae]|uniref:non-specific serine/threonine protein kinase n=1 Tax=Stylonychia lemnae TaxID=5949 RepID=A0A078AJL7_STYLE|nr:protein kinase domain containing protein [Stylonychia lemnae]|eukprot:CDW82560.1 protein kinase domain containing protein [Stylonychia lemnae]
MKSFENKLIKNKSTEQNLVQEEVKMNDESHPSLQECIINNTTSIAHQDCAREEAVQDEEEKKQQQSLSNSSINGKFNIIRRLGLDTQLHKQVYRVVNIRDSKEYVVKVYMRDEQEEYYQEVGNNRLIDRNTTRQVLMIESVSKEQVDAPLVLDGTAYSNYSYFVMPYYKNGTLLDLILSFNERRSRMSAQLQNYLWLQCTLCVYDLMDRSGLSHLDLKPDNFIIDDEYQLRLIDFGHLTLYNQQSNKQTGTPNYMAPEIYTCRKIKYNPEKVDVFNLGVILHIILFQNVPFKRAVENDPMYRYVAQNDFNGFFSAHNAQGYSLEGLKLIWKCLQKQAARRPTIHYLLAHPKAKQTNHCITPVLLQEIKQYLS